MRRLAVLVALAVGCAGLDAPVGAPHECAVVTQCIHPRDHDTEEVVETCAGSAQDAADALAEDCPRNCECDVWCVPAGNGSQLCAL